MDWDFYLYTLVIGFGGGVLGGLFGIGGSIVVIPLLTFVHGPNQQLYQASAMIMNVAVAASATIKHWLKHAVDQHVVLRLLPSALIGILAGVLLSNEIPTLVLQLLFAVFLAYLGVSELLLLTRFQTSSDEKEQEAATRGGIYTLVIGGITGLCAGLLGIGGGIILVPLLKRWCGMPIRKAIAASSATMLVTAAVGATAKNLSLPMLLAPDGTPLEVKTSLLIAAGLIPTAFIGSYMGAALTHSLPLKKIKLLFALLIVAAGARMTWSAIEGDAQVVQKPGGNAVGQVSDLAD